MPVAAPNRTRLRLLASVLYLEQFTVAELCHHAGLQPSQAYRILSDLQREGILESSSVVSEGKAAAHCPPKRYVLTGDAEVREELESDLDSFLPDSEYASENRQLKRAQIEIGELSLELDGVRLESFTQNDLTLWNADFDKRLKSVQRVLKRAFWESSVDFSEGDHTNHPIIKARADYENVEAKFRSQVAAEESNRSATSAKITWIDIFSTAVADFLVPALAVTNLVGASLVKEIVKFSTQLTNEVKKEGRNDPTRLAATLLRGFISSWELDLREARSSSEILAALAKNYIVYGKQAEIALLCMEKLLERKQDYKAAFNLANVADLADRPNEAYEFWKKYLDLRKPRDYSEQTLVARVNADQWSRDAYEEAVSTITKSCNAVVSAFSEVPFDAAGKGTVIESKLYNPLYEESEHEAPLIPIAEPLLQDKKLYFVTTAAEQPVMLGHPRVARAGLYHCGINQRDAWDMAVKTAEDERIIRVDFVRDPTPEVRGIVSDVLTAKLSAAIVDKGRPRLSPKEMAIITCITQGKRNKEIAYQLGTTEQVIKNYLRNIYDKFGVSDRLELALYCRHNQLQKKFAAGSVNAEGADAVLAPPAAHQTAQAEK